MEVVPSLAAALGFTLPALFAALLVSLLISGESTRGVTVTAVLLTTAIAAIFHLLGHTNRRFSLRALSLRRVARSPAC